MHTVLFAYDIISIMQPKRGADLKKKKPIKKRENTIAKDVTDALQLPKDLVLGAVILSVTGQSEAYVENYRGIIEYTNQKIRFQTKTCQVEMQGKNLQIDYYTNDEMKIVGKIDCIRYQQ